MGKDYITREGQTATIDVYSELTTLGSDATPGTPKVPPKATELLEMLVCAVTNMAAAAVSSGIVKLEGAGLKNGSETFAVGGNSSRIATGGNIYAPVRKIPVGVAVVPLQNIHITVQAVNEDAGEMSFGVTLVFKVPNN